MTKTAPKMTTGVDEFDAAVQIVFTQLTERTTFQLHFTLIIKKTATTRSISTKNDIGETGRSLATDSMRQNHNPSQAEKGNNFLFKEFLVGGWSQVSCQRCLVKSDAYKLLKEGPLWQSHLWRDDWVAQWSELFPSRLPALQLLPVDSIHFRKWIACGAFPKSWVSSFVVGSHSYFLIEDFFFLSSSTSRLI